MKTIDVNGMAKKLCSTKGSIYAQVSKRDIPRWCIVKRGQRILFDEEAVDRWLESSRLEPLPNPS